MTFIGLFAPLLPKVLPKKNKEPFDDSTDGVAVILILLFWAIDMILFVWAIYLSFRRNNGFDIGAFLAACCCSPCYVVYALAVPVTPAPPRL
jgi:hypothetical protein